MAQAELDELCPLLAELEAWRAVYQRWQAHPLAGPELAALGVLALNDTDHELLRRLGSAEFALLSETAARLRWVGETADALSAGAGDIVDRLAVSWPGRAGQPALRPWTALSTAAAEHAAGARDTADRLGAATEAVRSELRVAVQRVLVSVPAAAASRTPHEWLQKIDRITGQDDAETLRRSLDGRCIRYARAVTALREHLGSAADGIGHVWGELEQDLRRIDRDPYAGLGPVALPPTDRALLWAAGGAAASVLTTSASAPDRPAPACVPELGDTDALRAEPTGEVQVPELPDGPATVAAESTCPGAVHDRLDRAARPAEPVLAGIVAWIAAILAAAALNAVEQR